MKLSSYIFIQIRLQRSALEWSGNYKFWSCADVDIVKPRIGKALSCINGKLDTSNGK